MQVLKQKFDKLIDFRNLLNDDNVKKSDKLIDFRNLLNDNNVKKCSFLAGRPKSFHTLITRLQKTFFHVLILQCSTYSLKSFMSTSVRPTNECVTMLHNLKNTLMSTSTTLNNIL